MHLTTTTLALATVCTTALASHAHNNHANLNARAATACSTSKPHATGYFTGPDSSGIPLDADPGRTYTLYIPDSYSGDYIHPLIISYHGHGDDSDQEADISEFTDASVNGDYIVAFPQGAAGENGEAAWQGAPYAADGVDDVAFTADLLAHLRDTFCVDDQRIYASGKSNGGGFVDTLACSDVGNQFAAFSACSGAFYTDTAIGDCPAAANGTGVYPFLETHGSADTTIHYDGNDGTNGEHGVTPAIPAWLGWWAQRNGCAADDVGTNTFSNNDSLNQTVWSCNSHNDVVTGYWVEGLAHDWPGTQGSPTDWHASPVILDFYAQWHLSDRGLSS